VNNFKTSKIKEAIKKLLKKNNFHYSDLAEHLECSELTVKRILGEEELSLTRLIQICEFLRISLADIETMIQTEKSTDFKFTEKQQIFLVKNKSFLAYLLEIYNGLSPQQIAEKYKLTDKSTDKYLIGLEKYDLIKVTSKNKIRPYFDQFPTLGAGPLGVAHYRAIVQNASQFLIDHIGENILKNNTDLSKKNHEGFSVQVMDIDLETYKIYMNEIKQKLEEMARVSIFEEKTKEKKQLKTAVLILGSAVLETDAKEIKVLQKSFGEIVNL